MSEQRFTIQKASGMYLHLPIFDNDVEMADGDVCILLNEQQATIQSLKEENEQLRQRIKELQRSREYWIQDNNRLTKKNNELIAKIDFLERVIDGDV